MLTKFGSHVALIDAAVANKNELPWFVRGNDSAMKRVAAIEPVLLSPEKFLYMRTRMVSAVERYGPNANGDAFEDAELAARYATFIQAAVNIDHDNDSPDKAVGFILDARYIPDAMYVEGVHAIDRDMAESKRPGIIRAIEAGVVTDTSMGCYVEKSICSECLKEAGWDGKDFSQINKFAALLSVGRGIATVPEEYCHHIGKFGEKKGGASGPYEINRGVTFFEDSIITTAGADKDAKYLEKLAQLGIDWKKFIIKRKQEGGSAMSFPKAAADGLKLETKEEKGDYEGKPADKDKALFDQSKGKSESTLSKGNATATMEEKGDYVLASKNAIAAIALVRRLAKDNPEAVKGLVFDEQEIGGKPDAVKQGEEGQADAMEDSADKRKPAPVVEDKEKGLVASIVAAIKEAFSGKKEAIEGTGNPTETAIEKKEQYLPSSGDPDRALSNQAKGQSGGTPMKGNPLQTATDPKDHPLTASEKRPFIARRAASDDSARLEFMVSELQKGRSFEDAEKSARDKFTATSRVARRKEIAEDLNRGSMGSPGLPENIKTEKDEEKSEAKCGSEKSAMDRPNETPDQRQDEGTDETKETAPMRADAGKKEAQTPPVTPDANPATATPPMPPSTAKDGPDKVVEQLDRKSDALEAMVRAKRIRASMLAKAGFSDSAKTNLMDIKVLEASVSRFEKIATDIENIVQSMKPGVVKGASRLALRLRGASLMAQARNTMNEVGEAVMAMEKRDKSDNEKVEAARKHAAMEAELRREKMEKTETRNRLVAMLKSKAVKELIALGQGKGLVTPANLQEKIAELSAMSDVEFEATRKVWASLPASSGRPSGFVPRAIREAARVPEGMGVPVERTASSVAQGDLDSGTLFD